MSQIGKTERELRLRKERKGMIGHIQRLVVPLFGLAAAFALFACAAPEPGNPATRELNQQEQKLEQEVQKLEQEVQKLEQEVKEKLERQVKELLLRLQAALKDKEELQEFVRATGRSLVVHNNCGERITTLAIWYVAIEGKETPWTRSGVPFESGDTITLLNRSDRRVLATENAFAIFGGIGPLEEGAKSLNGASDTERRPLRGLQIPVRITLAEEEGMTKYVIPLCG